MKLVLLGTGGYHPTDRRQTACLMLPELGVVLDAGSAMYRVRETLQTDTLDIFVTHAHLDHVIGLTFLFDVLHQRPMQHVHVYGEDEKLAAIRQHLCAELLFPATPPCELRTLPAEFELPGHGRLTHFPLEHPGGAVGFRLDWPQRSMAYVTDTTAHPQAAYIDQIRGVDLLIHECYFSDADAERAELTGHSCITPVAEVAHAAQVERMVLVHVNPLDSQADPVGVDVARAVFPRTELGTDRMEIDF